MPGEKEEDFMKEENLGGEEKENLGEEENLGEGEEGEKPGGEEGEEKEFDLQKVQNLFDPNEYPEELQPAFKKMQGIFTKKMQENKDKLALVSLMEENPEVLAKMLAEKTGLAISKNLVGGKEEEPIEQGETEKWIRKIIQDEVKSGNKNTELAVAKMQAAQKVGYLNEHHPDWTLYEDEMSAIVKKHPTLTGDMDTVYELAKKKFNQANEIIIGSKKRTKVAIKTTTQRKEKTDVRPKSPREALEAACDKLGIQ